MIKLSRKGFIVQLFSHLRNTLTSIFIALAIAAGGGGGSDAQSPQSNDSSSPIDDVSSSLQSSVPFSEYTPEEQERARKSIETINNVVKMPPSIEAIGEDIDSNGVRDDVQEYIDGKYTVGSLVHSRTMNFAKEEQRMLMVAHDSELVRQHALSYEIALDCWFESFDSDTELREAIRSLSAVLDNSDERVFRSLLKDGKLASLQGELPVTDISNCE